MITLDNSDALVSPSAEADAPARPGRRCAGWSRLPLADADVRFCPQWLGQAEARALFDLIYRRTRWRQDKVTLFGRTHAIPRLHQWYADAGLRYRWSGLTMQPEPWFDELDALRRRVAESAGARFNSVLVNFYRDGCDSMGWHADDEPELGVQPVIASLSLGVERDFVMRHRGQSGLRQKQIIKLAGGSLLVMAGNTQQFWQHALPKRRRIKAPRINLTVRRILHAPAA